MCLSARTIMNLIILSHYFQKYQDLWPIFSSVYVVVVCMYIVQYVVDLTRSSQYKLKIPSIKVKSTSLLGFAYLYQSPVGKI